MSELIAAICEPQERTLILEQRKMASAVDTLAMKVHSVQGEVSPLQAGVDGLNRLHQQVMQICEPGTVPLRLAITEMAENRWYYEVESLADTRARTPLQMPSIFSYRPRRYERTAAFNAVMLIPTGIDCAIGGHAGDATAAVRLLATVCDHLVVHPNVVNASDINEQADNCLYVEGSLIARLMMGDISLRKVRSNRILVITEARNDGPWAVDQVVNTANAAHATLGVSCEKVIVLKHGLSMTMVRSQSGRAVGDVSGLEALIEVLEIERAEYDAVAICSRITAFMDTRELLHSYFEGGGPNPWGGVEAALTHTVSMAFDIPSAHAPTMEDMSLRMECFGQTDPRKAAEAISTSYAFCLLKGLHRAPAVVRDPDGSYDPSLLAAEDISCLVIPDGCVGIPTIAALLQGIPVVAVRNNTNLMKNDLRKLPFIPGRLFFVENYREAVGLMLALKAGASPDSVLRPLQRAEVVEY